MRRVLFVVLLLIGFGAPHARADALPEPQVLDDFQKLLIGIWQEDGAAYPSPGMLGHSQVTRTLVFGNTSFAMVGFSSIPMVGNYEARGMIGTWTAERIDEKTLKVTMFQDPEHGTAYTLIFEGDDAFVMTDAEQGYLIPSRFSRRGVRIEGGQ